MASISSWPEGRYEPDAPNPFDEDKAHRRDRAAALWIAVWADLRNPESAWLRYPWILLLPGLCPEGLIFNGKHPTIAGALLKKEAFF